MDAGLDAALSATASKETNTKSVTTSKIGKTTIPINNSNINSNIVLSNLKPGKTPPSSWTKLPKNLGGKNLFWNPKGYCDEKYGDTNGIAIQS